MNDDPRLVARYFLASLGLEPGAQVGDVRDAYRRLAKQLHPDRFPLDSEARVRAEERFKQLNEACSWLVENVDYWAGQVDEPPPSSDRGWAEGGNGAGGASSSHQREPPMADPPAPGSGEGKTPRPGVWRVGAWVFFIGLALLIGLSAVDNAPNQRGAEPLARSASTASQVVVPSVGSVGGTVVPSYPATTTPASVPIELEDSVKDVGDDGLDTAIRAYETADAELNLKFRLVGL